MLRQIDHKTSEALGRVEGQWTILFVSFFEFMDTTRKKRGTIIRLSSFAAVWLSGGRYFVNGTDECGLEGTVGSRQDQLKVNC